MILDSVHKLLLEFIDKTTETIFLTGKAGTGKTTFLRYLKSTIKKNMVVVAPTAVAGINAGGTTIHSFFQMPFGPVLAKQGFDRFDFSILPQFSNEKLKTLKTLELLIIDEISMVRADSFDYIDVLLQAVRGSTRPFGGVQVLLIGDLYQLQPVYDKDWPVLKNIYEGPYFFDSLAVKRSSLLTLELTSIFRQTDLRFIGILNAIRNADISAALLAELNVRAVPATANWKNEYVVLTTHNHLVSEINRQRLAELEGEVFTFKATITGDFPKDALPAEEVLLLKAGCQVMFIKNDSSGKKQYYNGRTAVVTSISHADITVKFFDDGSTLEVLPETWQNVKYEYQEAEKKISQSNAGSFIQYPIRLAWAITIHKSQGLTFEKAIIDVKSAFAYGQTYVALSRCTSLEGLILQAPIDPENIKTDPKIVSFMRLATANQPDERLLQRSTGKSDRDVLFDVFDFSRLLQLGDLMISKMPETAENGNYSTTIPSKIIQILSVDLKAVGDRFVKQELLTAPEDGSFFVNEKIKDRLRQSSVYFTDKLQQLEELLRQLFEVCSSLNVPNDFYSLYNFLAAGLKIKSSAFLNIHSASSGIDIVRSTQEASLSYRQVSRNWKPQPAKNEKPLKNPALYESLVAWRQQFSQETSTPDYTIISEKALIEVAAKLPRSVNQLSQIKNIGPAKAAVVGEQILAVIRQHLGENELFS